MLGLSNKEKDTNINTLINMINNKDKKLVGVRLDNSYIENLKVTPALYNTEISSGYFATEIELNPLPSQLPMIKTLNTSLIKSGLGYIEMDEETRELHEDSKYKTLLSSYYEGESDIKYAAHINFDAGKPIKRIDFKLVGISLTIFKLHDEYDGAETNLYIAFTDREYDGQTMLGTLAIEESKMKRIDTLKLLSLISSNPLFGNNIISTEYTGKGILNILYDTTQVGMGVILPYMEDVNKHKYFYIYSGETELYIELESVLNSNIEIVDGAKNQFRMVIELTQGNQLIINFG